MRFIRIRIPSETLYFFGTLVGLILIDARMESLPTLDKIDEEIARTIQVFHDELNVHCK